MRSNGTYVKSYGDDGVLQILGLGASNADSITATKNGKFLISASIFGLVVARLNSDGTFDHTYRGGGESFLPDQYLDLLVRDTALTANGDLILAAAGDLTSTPPGEIQLLRISGSPDVSSGQISVSAGGVLTVRGTDGNDTISVIDDRVAENTDGFFATVNGKTTRFADGIVKSIVVNAGAGNDSITIGTGPVSVNAGAGNDTMMIGDGDVTLAGGSGNDTADFSGFSENLKITLDNQPNNGPAGAKMNVESDIENVIGGSGNDLIIGNPSFNHLYGGPGNDTLYGGGGNDTLEGGHGHDQLFGQSGNDLLIARDGTRDTVDGGSGMDSASVDDSASVKDQLSNVESLLT